MTKLWVYKEVRFISPSDMFCHCLLAGVQFVAEGTLVVFL